MFFILSILCISHVGEMVTRENRMAANMGRFMFGIIMMPMLLAGCGHVSEKRQLTSAWAEANELFSGGSYDASLARYEQIMAADPAAGDRVLFEMGIIHAYPKNDRKDYQKSLECLQRLLQQYPDSSYRQNSQTMILTINTVALKDQTIAEQQKLLETLREEVKTRDEERVVLNKRIDELQRQAVAAAIRGGSVDRILIEKKERRLTVMARGEALKSYRIALGGNPVGPKERQGDNRTPEGTYTIDSRNRNSRYHLALHLSYPNERDRKRAEELGVAPGGDIMIHGLKNGFSWVGEAHTEADWTKGCIAVTDEEIEEIARLAPLGTTVEIRP